MESLTDYRNKIDEIDKTLISLFEERMETAYKIALYKKNNNLGVLQKGREQEVINKAIANLTNHDLDEFATSFMNDLMSISRAYQAKFVSTESVSSTSHLTPDVVGFQGVSGAYSEEALIAFFGENQNRKAYDDFEDVFLALKNDDIKYGVLPIENSDAGAVSDVYDLLLKYGFHIVGEKVIAISHNLIATKGAKLSDITEIYSHPQGIMQCSNFLKSNKQCKVVPFANTAMAAQYVMEQNSPHLAAIASKRAAEIYNLDIIKPAVNNATDNNTRFIIISKDNKSIKTPNKVSVVFSLEHEAGTLYRLISYFAENNINMNKIESRPSKDKAWKYVLYVDFEGTLEDKNTEEALNRIRTDAEFFNLLGCYGSDM